MFSYVPLTAAGVLRETFALEVNAKDYGIAPSATPRVDRSVSTSWPSHATFHGIQVVGFDGLHLDSFRYLK